MLTILAEFCGVRDSFCSSSAVRHGLLNGILGVDQPFAVPIVSHLPAITQPDLGREVSTRRIAAMYALSGAVKTTRQAASARRRLILEQEYGGKSNRYGHYSDSQ